MSFVLVMLLTITTLVRVETTNASRAIDQLLARENARLGMLIAVGNLQKYAGPDQRATARADAFASSTVEINNAQWLGITDASAPTSELSEVTWLVSNPDLTDTLPTALLDSSNSVTIIPEFETSAGLTIPEVRAPLRRVGDTNEQFAYWVSDESMKASLATRPEIDAQENDWLDETFGATYAKRLDQVIPKRTGVEMLFAPNGEDSQQVLSQLAKISSIDQLPLTSAWDLTNFEDYFHDITDRTYGILASTTGTGLKKDLSLRPDLMPIAGQFQNLYNFEAYMEEPLDEFLVSTPYIPSKDDLRRRYEITAPSTTTPGEIKDGIYPVITDFKILLHVHVAGEAVVDATALSVDPITDPEEIVVRAQIHIELWNPHTSALVPENLVLEIKDLPDVTITFQGGRGRTEPFVVSLDEAFNNGSSGNEGFFIELPFEDRGFSNHDDVSWLPGRVYNWIGPNNYSGGSSKNDRMANFYQRGLSNAIWYAGTGIVAPISLGDFGLAAPDSNFSVALRKISSDGDLDDGPELLRVENIAYASFDTGINFDKYSRSTTFGYQIQRDESGFVALTEDPWEKSRWLRVEDPRNPRPLFDDTGNGIGAFQAPNGLDPTGYTSTGVSQSSFLFDRVAGGSGLRPSEDIPLFEAFRQRPLSIGELQHINLIGERPFSIGNSWGSKGTRRYNRLFDETFLSGLGPDDTSPDPTQHELFPNHRLRNAAEITGETAPELNTILQAEENSAQYLVTEGAFNVNSTSASAWAAILGSMYFEDWEVANIDDTNGDLIEETPTRTADLGQAILRFPQSAQEVFHTGLYANEFQPPTEFFRLGAKYFEDASDENDIAPYTDLGEAIAERIRERIRALGPFTSMEEFLSPVALDTFVDPNAPDENLSLLERAILDVSELNTSADEGEIWHHTSSFLSQADVMTGIAPIANVRGDTFYIRSVGLSQIGLSSANQATAICEARVQRIPQTVDPNDDILQPDENGLGRQFKIVSIRWVDTP